MSDTQADSQVSAIQGPGHALAAAREARGVSIDDVAMRLKFAPRQIEALEADEYERLPGLAIVRGMVRSYARLMEIDSAPLIAELEQRMQTGPNTVHPADMHVPIKESKKGSRLLLVLSLIILLAVAAFALDRYVRDRRAMQAAVKTRPVATAPASTTRAVPVSQPLASAEPAAPKVDSAPAFDMAATAETTPVQEQVASVAPAAPESKTSELKTSDSSAPTPAATPVGPDKALQMRFSDEVWVEVKDTNGKVLVSRLAPAGSELALDGDAPLSVVLGNADAVDVRYEGKPVDVTAHARSGVARLKLE